MDVKQLKEFLETQDEATEIYTLFGKTMPPVEVDEIELIDDPTRGEIIVLKTP